MLKAHKSKMKRNLNKGEGWNNFRRYFQFGPILIENFLNKCKKSQLSTFHFFNRLYTSVKIVTKSQKSKMK